MDISFYENNSEHMQFLKTCKLQALSYYSKLDSDKITFKDELVEYYFQMERGKCTNNLSIFFSNIHKQIEILVNSSITDIISIDKLKEDLESKRVKNYKNEELWKNIFYIKDGETDSTEYSTFKKTSKRSRLSYTSKINIFYFYFIGGNESNDSYRKKYFNYYSTNDINLMRNYFNHGYYQGSEENTERIKQIKQNNTNNLVWFYRKYLTILYSIIKAYNENILAKALKL